MQANYCVASPGFISLLMRLGIRNTRRFRQTYRLICDFSKDQEKAAELNKLSRQYKPITLCRKRPIGIVSTTRYETITTLRYETITKLRLNTRTLTILKAGALLRLLLTVLLRSLLHIYGDFGE